tara:strand:+ start:334 stop:1206 length:873 start_codon:yes stop_codon:yes gene_type:complete
MNFIEKLPGPLLVFLGAFCLSFGGLIVKSFEGATLWQILFWRQFFFVILVSIFLFFTYKKKFFIAFYESGIPGFIGGIILGCGFSAYVYAMYNTTVANTNFIIQTQAIFLAIFGYFFLKEKISKLTLTSIILAVSGIILMVGNSLSPGQLSGNIVACVMPISFSVLIIIVRKNPNVDMIPLQLFAGIAAMLIGYFVSIKINISINDIFLAFIAGFFQVGLGFIFITIGAKKTLSAMVGILMMTEAVLGPLWAWIFLEENPQFIALVGGSIILFAVFIQFYSLLQKEKYLK